MISGTYFNIYEFSHKYEWAKGGGTWTSYSLTPQQGYVEVEGEMEIP